MREGSSSTVKAFDRHTAGLSKKDILVPVQSGLHHSKCF